MLLISTNGKTSLFDPHKFITNYLNTDLPTIPQSCSDEGLTLETSAKHHIPQASKHTISTLLIKPILYIDAPTNVKHEGEVERWGRCAGAFDILRVFFKIPNPREEKFGQNRSNIPIQIFVNFLCYLQYIPFPILRNILQASILI